MTRWTQEIRSSLRGTKSIARQGRATPELKAARRELNRLLHQPAAERIEQEVRAALAAHDQATQELTGTRRIAHPPLNG